MSVRSLPAVAAHSRTHAQIRGALPLACQVYGRDGHGISHRIINVSALAFGSGQRQRLTRRTERSGKSDEIDAEDDSSAPTSLAALSRSQPPMMQSQKQKQPLQHHPLNRSSQPSAPFPTRTTQFRRGSSVHTATGSRATTSNRHTRSGPLPDSTIPVAATATSAIALTPANMHSSLNSVLMLAPISIVDSVQLPPDRQGDLEPRHPPVNFRTAAEFRQMLHDRQAAAAEGGQRRGPATAAPGASSTVSHGKKEPPAPAPAVTAAAPRQFFMPIDAAHTGLGHTNTSTKTTATACHRADTAGDAAGRFLDVNQSSSSAAAAAAAASTSSDSGSSENVSASRSCLPKHETSAIAELQWDQPENVSVAAVSSEWNARLPWSRGLNSTTTTTTIGHSSSERSIVNGRPLKALDLRSRIEHPAAASSPEAAGAAITTAVPVSSSSSGSKTLGATFEVNSDQLDHDGDYQKAKRYALMLLQHSPLPAGALARRLAARGHTDRVVQPLLSRLAEGGALLSDRTFARLYAASKWNASLTAPAKIQRELAAQGLAPVDVAAGLVHVFGPSRRIHLTGPASPEEMAIREALLEGARRHLETRSRAAILSRPLPPLTDAAGADSSNSRAACPGHLAADRAAKAKERNAQRRRLATWMQYRGHDMSLVLEVFELLNT